MRLLRPVKDNVVIRLLTRESKSKGGIFIPEVAQTESQHGVVEAIGVACTAVKKGDTVIVNKTRGTVFHQRHPENGLMEFLVVGEKHIQAITE